MLSFADVQEIVNKRSQIDSEHGNALPLVKRLPLESHNEITLFLRVRL